MSLSIYQRPGSKASKKMYPGPRERCICGCSKQSWRAVLTCAVMSSPRLSSPVPPDKNHFKGVDLYQAEFALLPCVVISPDALQPIGHHSRGGKLPRVPLRVHSFENVPLSLSHRSHPFHAVKHHACRGVLFLGGCNRQERGGGRRTNLRLVR